MNVVKVRLRKPRRVLSFLSDGIALQRGEACVVHTDRGLEWGECVLPGEPCPAQFERRNSLRVVRRATRRDEDTLETITKEEKKARYICLERIQKRELPMKLVDVEYTFDKRKIVFFFTAEERVDFRELVRDLAHELRTRIELRHIQVRDEAKMVGGLGCCGRELCCASWLGEFKPISMRMAKRQDLSLNPSKISGQCGRLLCCLSYENDLYDVKKKRKPKPERAPAEKRPPQAETGDWESSRPAEQARPRPSQEDAPRERTDAPKPGEAARDDRPAASKRPENTGAKPKRRQGSRRRRKKRPEKDGQGSGGAPKTGGGEAS